MKYARHVEGKNHNIISGSDHEKKTLLKKHFLKNEKFFGSKKYPSIIFLMSQILTEQLNGKIFKGFRPYAQR